MAYSRSNYQRIIFKKIILAGEFAERFCKIAGYRGFFGNDKGFRHDREVVTQQPLHNQQAAFSFGGTETGGERLRWQATSSGSKPIPASNSSKKRLKFSIKMKENERQFMNRSRLRPLPLFAGISGNLME
jgi:hypothetical protein